MSKTALVIGATGATGKDLSLRPMPTAQVAKAMIVMDKEGKEGVRTLEPKNLWNV